MDISKRWAQHTKGDTISVLANAFRKYGLSQKVREEGIYKGSKGSFKFEVLEECEPKKRFKVEDEYIKKLKPQYNCQYDTDPKHYEKIHESKEGQVFVQYHNYDSLGWYPSFSEEDNGYPQDMGELNHIISTKKRLALYSKGAFIFLIMGMTMGDGKKAFFLWSKTEIDETGFDEEPITFGKKEKSYYAFGEQTFLNEPILLNFMNGFDDFKKAVANFSVGLINIDKQPFIKTLEKVTQEHAYSGDPKYPYEKYLQQFEKKNKPKVSSISRPNKKRKKLINKRQNLFQRILLFIFSLMRKKSECKK